MKKSKIIILSLALVFVAVISFVALPFVSEYGANFIFEYGLPTNKNKWFYYLDKYGFTSNTYEEAASSNISAEYLNSKFGWGLDQVDLKDVPFCYTNVNTDEIICRDKSLGVFVGGETFTIIEGEFLSFSYKYYPVKNIMYVFQTKGDKNYLEYNPSTKKCAFFDPNSELGECREEHVKMIEMSYASASVINNFKVDLDDVLVDSVIQE